MFRLENLITGLCPNGVPFTDIKSVAEVGTGSSNGNEADENGMYPFFIRSKTVKLKCSYEYDEEAIIIPGEGGIGEIFHYVNGKYALHQRVYRIHFTKPSINTKFVYYYMEAFFKKFILRKAVSATVTSIRKPMIESFQIPVPPLDVQQEIVRILDQFTQLTVKLTTELTAEIAARKEQYMYYASLLLSGVTASQPYKRVQLSNFAKFVYGFTDKAQITGDARFLRITDIDDNGCLKEKDAKYITLNRESRKYMVHQGDLLMARTGATYGKTLFVPDDTPSVYASFLIKICLDNSIMLNRFYWHFAQSHLYWEQAAKLVSAGGQPQFNSGAIGRVLVPVPPLPEQRRIVAILDRFDALCNDLTSGLPAEIAARQKQYEYYRDKLLTFKKKSSDSVRGA